MALVDANMLKNKAQGALSGFSTGQRAVVLIAVVTLVAGGVFFAQWASKPTMVPLFSNLNADDASSITAKLQSSKTPFELADGGQTVMVPQSKVYQLRLDMAAADLPTGGSEGYKLLDKQGITTSEFKQHVDYQRALEGELSRTIGAIDGVSAATVHLVIPQQDVFSNDNRKPSASVLVKTAPGKTIPGSTVKSIVNLVASSVEGLTSDQVTVADSNGKMLAAPGQTTDASDDSQRAAQTALEDSLNAKIQSMLTPLVGAGKAVVQTRAELDWDKSQSTSEVYNPNNKQVTALSQSTDTETYSGTGSDVATGCIGNGTPANNTVCQSPQGTASGSGGYNKSSNKQDNGVDKTVTQTQKSPGTVNRLSVAVLLDGSVPNIDQAQVRNLVEQAAGIQNARGDTVTVSQMAFDNSAADQAKKDLAEAEKAKKSDQMMGMIKTGATFLIILLVLVVLFITTKRRSKQSSASPISMAELDAAMPMLPSDMMLNQLDAANAAIDDNSPEALERAKVDKEITDLIERQPDEVASLLRSWLADRRN